LCRNDRHNRVKAIGSRAGNAEEIGKEFQSPSLPKLLNKALPTESIAVFHIQSCVNSARFVSNRFAGLQVALLNGSIVP
jgi:hypothetical protein